MRARHGACNDFDIIFWTVVSGPWSEPPRLPPYTVPPSRVASHARPRARCGCRTLMGTVHCSSDRSPLLPRPLYAESSRYACAAGKFPSCIAPFTPKWGPDWQDWMAPSKANPADPSWDAKGNGNPWAVQRVGSQYPAKWWKDTARWQEKTFPLTGCRGCGACLAPGLSLSLPPLSKPPWMSASPALFHADHPGGASSRRCGRGGDWAVTGPCVLTDFASTSTSPRRPSRVRMVPVHSL